MKCRECAEKGWDHEEVVQACRGSIYETLIFLCLFERIAGSWIHKEFCDWLQAQIEAGHKSILLMLPRDFLKTTMLAGLAVWGWINDPETRIFLFHSSGKQASKLVPVVQRIVLGEPMKHFFPKLIPDTSKVPWNSQELTIPRTGNYTNASLEAHGIRSTVVGGHADWHFHDDIVELGAAESEAEIQSALQFFQTAPSMFDRPEKELTLVTGTLWQGGFYEWCQQTGLFKSLILGATYDPRFEAFLKERGKESDFRYGDPVWPEFFPLSRLMRLKQRMGVSNYMRQHENLAAEDDEMVFKEKDLRFARLDENGILSFAWSSNPGAFSSIQNYKIPLRTLSWYATIDPATGESKDTDESAIEICGFLEELGLAFVIEDWGGRVLPDRLVDKIFEMYQRWHPWGLQKFGIEAAGYQATLRRWLESEQRRRGVFFPVDMLSTKNVSKERRIIDNLQPYVATGRLHVMQHHRNLLREMTTLRIRGGNLVGRSPNRVDALAMQAFHYWKPLNRQDSELNVPDEGEPVMNVYQEKARYGLECET